MKKLLIFALVALVCSCGTGGNKYLGKIPGLTDQNEIVDQTQKLKGVKVSCVSGQPEYFSVLGDVAVCDGITYQVLLKFHKTASIFSSGSIDILFVNSQDNKVYGNKTQIMFGGSLENRYTAGSVVLYSLFLNDIQYSDLSLLLDKTDRFVLSIREKPVEVESPDTRPAFTPAGMAVDFQEEFYKAIVDNDMEAYNGCDYGFGEFEFGESYEWAQFNKAYDLWKMAYPEKWEVIKAFRKQKIEEKYALCALDVEDPDWTKL